MRAFYIWMSTPKPLIKRLNFSKPEEKTTQKPPQSPGSKTHRTDGSPKDVSLRLYNKAQEIKNHKDEIRKSLIPDYTFTPKLSNGTKKWLNSKSKKEIKSNEEIAVVSGSKVLSFTKFSNDVKTFIESKIPAPGIPTHKSRIITSRLERRSDIVMNIHESPTLIRTHNKSVSKAYEPKGALAPSLI